MKLEFLVILILSMSVEAWARGEVVGKWPFMVSTGLGAACAMDVDGVTCWGSWYYRADDPTSSEILDLKSPTQISVGDGQICAVDSGKLICRGRRLVNYIPKLNSPTQVSVGDNEICALDADGVKCWDDTYSLNFVPDLKSPTQVNVGVYHVCAIDAEGVKCWGNNFKGQLDVPDLKSPIQVSAGQFHTCALDAEGVKCWGDNDMGQLNVPQLKSPIQISAGNDHTCALDAEGVKCWGDNSKKQLNVPALISPIQVSAGGYYTCALDAEGVKCWGDRNEPEVPALNFDLIAEAISFVTPVRAEYLQAIADIKRASKPEAEYLRYSLISPAVFTVDSGYFLETIVPKFRLLMDSFKTRLNFSSDINEILDAEEPRKLALVSIKSVLSVGIKFLSSDQQLGVQDAFRATGAALSDPMNNQKIKDLLFKIDSLNAEKQKLKSSPKSAFLVDTLELAANWLREKVK